MNVLQVLSTTIRMYTAHAGWYLLAGFALLLSALVALGLTCAGLLSGMVLAIAAGGEGEWVRLPLALAMVLLSLLAGLTAGSIVLFATLGSFVHTCAQIGAGVREVTVLGFLEYARHNAGSYWLIGAVQALLGTGAAVPFILLGSWLGSSVWGPLAIAGALGASAAFFAVQWPVWTAMSAQAVERRGALASLALAFDAARRAPATGLLAVGIWWLAFVIPTPMLIFYPLYFFFIFAPASSVLGLVYYESARGMLK